MPDTPLILVPFDGSIAAERLLRYACRTALADSDQLIVLCVAALPPDLEPDEAPLDTAASAMRALVRAQRIGREEGVVATFRLTYAHDLASAILAEAARDGAAVIGLSLDEHARGETALIRPAVQSVLAAAQQTVLLVNPAAALPARTITSAHSALTPGG